jgi:hypothetical protein
MDNASLAIWWSRGRIAIGLTAMAVPRTAVKRLSVDGEAAGLGPMLARMVGARDLALGLGTLVAVDKGTPVRGWLEGCALADATDTVSAIFARKQLTDTSFKGTLALAGGSALLCYALSHRLDNPPAPHPGQPEAVVTGHHD